MGITYDDIVDEQKAQNGVIRKTSLIFSDTFTKLTGSKVYLKNEFEQKTKILENNESVHEIRKNTLFMFRREQ